MNGYFVSSAASFGRRSFLGRVGQAFFLVFFLSAAMALVADPMQVVKGHVRPLFNLLPQTGQLGGSNRLNLVISLPLRNAPGLSNLLRQIYDPASPLYHQYLTPGEFTDRFGPTTADYQAVIAFANANHLEVTAEHSNRMILDVRGSAAEVEKALHLTLYSFRHPSEHRSFYAPDREPSVLLNVPVLHIGGLDNFALPRPRLKNRQLAAKASPESGSGPHGSYMGTDFRRAYVPDTSLDGTGQVVGLLQFDGYSAGDITYYENKAGLRNVPLQNVLLDGFNGNPTYNGGEVEVSLDIEMAVSMATNLSKVIVYEAGPNGDWHDLLNRMANDNLAHQLSCSWYLNGGTADSTADQIFQQMAAQGQSFFNASGDDAAYTGLISFPGDSPYITQVGGTTLSTSGAGTWLSETVWNAGTESGDDGVGSGGGISTQYAIPNWQTNINMLANQGSTNSRNTPDVAMVADNIYVRADGADLNRAGTSCAAPLWAAFAALVNQEANAGGHAPVGFINPALSAIGLGGGYGATFHDITTGNNTWSGSPSKFNAVSGYDLCTGWGTPTGQKLIDVLANPEPLVILPVSGFSTIGGAGGPFSLTTETFTLTNTGAGTLTWSLANSSAWLSVSATNGTLIAGGPSAQIAVNLNSTALSLPIGTYPSTLSFTNETDGTVQTRIGTLSVIAAPVITEQPADQAVIEGGTATLTAQVSGGSPISFQWQLNRTNLVDGGSVSGANGTNLTISDVSTVDTGTYMLVATNYAGAAASRNAELTLSPSAPVIVLQPTDQTVYAGATVSFSVGVLGSKPFFYRWNFNGTNLIGATNPVLTLNDVQLADGGSYFVIITNSYGETNSESVALKIDTLPPCDPAPSGIVAWWPANGDTVDVINGNNGIPEGAVGYPTGEVGQAFLFDGSSSYVTVPASASLDVGAGTGFTIEGWIDPGPLTMQFGAPIAEWDSDNGPGVQFWGSSSLYANLIDIDGNDHILQSANNVIQQGVWQHVAVTYDERSGTGVFYCNGAAVLTQNLGQFTPQTSYALNIGRRTSGTGAGYNFQGMIDELSIYNRALSSNDVSAIYVAGTNGKCATSMPIPPIIVVQPTNQTVLSGENVMISVTAMGTPPLWYQWSFDGTNIVGATNDVLSLEDVQSTNAGSYSVLITNRYGTTNSSSAVLTVNLVPPCDPMPGGIVAWWPANGDASDIVNGNNGTIVGAVGFPTGEVGETFSFDGTSTYVTVPASTTLNVGTGAGFSIEGWISPGPVTIQYSAPIVEWDSATSIGVQFWAANYLHANMIDTGGNDHIMQSANGSISQGVLQHVALTYDRASGTASFYCNGAVVLTQNVGSFTPQTSYGLNIGRRTAGNGAGYNFQGLIDELSIYDRPLSASEIAAIYLDGTNGKCYIPTPPIIFTQPTNQLAVIGATVGIAVAAAGTPPLCYQWSFDGTNLVGATNAILTLTNVQLTNSGTYCVSITNAYGFTNSVIITLSVYGVPPGILLQPTNETVYVGSTVCFNTAESGTPPLTYQWLFNGTNLIYGTNATLVLSNVDLSQAGDYCLVITNAFGATNTVTVVLTVNPPPPCDPVAAGSVGWWAAESNALDSASGNLGILMNGTSFVKGEVGTAFNFNGVTNFVLINPATSGSLDVGQDSGFTIEGWIRPGSVLPIMIIAGYEKVLGASASGNIGVQFLMNYVPGHGSLAGCLAANITDVNAAQHVFWSAGNVLIPSVWQHVALTYCRTSGVAAFYVNGNRTTSGNLGVFIPQTSFTNFEFGAQTTYATLARPIDVFSGQMDEMTLYGRALSSNEVAAVYLANMTGKCPLPASIAAQPANASVNLNSPASFKVVAGGTPPLNYQWSFNGSNIVNATNATLTLPSVQLTNAGVYTLRVTNLFGVAVSSNATLTVIDVLDHFSWGNLPSPRFANVPFGVSVQARDSINQVFTNFSGSVALSGNLAPVSPAISGGFTQGVWTGALTVPQTVSNLVLQANDGGGHAGFANPINVMAVPSLTMAKSGSSLLLYWPMDPSGFVLESSPSLVPPQWIQVAGSPFTVGNQSLQLVPISGTNVYYRLRYTQP